MTCPAVRAANGACVLEAGHAAAHRNAAGDEWPRRMVSAADEYRASCRLQGKAMRSLALQLREAIDALGPMLAVDAAAYGPALAKVGGVERALLAVATHLEAAGAE